MPDSLFGEADKLTIDPTVDYTDQLVGDDKPFKSAKDLARAVLERGQFIDRLKAENAQMRESLKGEAKLDEVLTTLRSRVAPPSGDSNLNNQQSDPTRNEVTPPSNSTATLSPEDVAKLIEQHDAKKTAEQNLNLVLEKAKQAFGANYQTELQTRANQLGIPLKELEDMAKARPAAFFKLLDISDTPRGSNLTPPGTRVNSAAVATTNTGRNFAYYEDLRKKVGEREYFTPKIQNQMFEDAKSMGAAFYS